MVKLDSFGNCEIQIQINFQVSEELLKDNSLGHIRAVVETAFNSVLQDKFEDTWREILKLIAP